jgi:hypothetical protein
LTLTGVAVEKVHFPQNSQKLGDRKCLEKRESCLSGILTQSLSDHFREIEFFNTHRRLHSFRIGHSYSSSVPIEEAASRWDSSRAGDGWAPDLKVKAYRSTYPHAGS